MAKKILIIVGDFVEDYEAKVPIQALEMLDIEVHVVSPGKKNGDKVITAIHDFEGHQTYTEKPGHYLQINFDFEQVSASNYDGLIVPGGRAPEFLSLDQNVIKIVQEFFTQNKPVTSQCHGTILLSAAGVLKDKELTGYPTTRHEAEKCGAKWVIHNSTFTNAVVCGNLVSSAAWPGTSAMLKEFIKLLGVKVAFS